MFRYWILNKVVHKYSISIQGLTSPQQVFFGHARHKYEITAKFCCILATANHAKNREERSVSRSNNGQREVWWDSHRFIKFTRELDSCMNQSPKKSWNLVLKERKWARVDMVSLLSKSLNGLEYSYTAWVVSRFERLSNSKTVPISVPCLRKALVPCPRKQPSGIDIS